MKMAYVWFGFLFVAVVSSYTITKSHVDKQLRRVHAVFVEGERQFTIVDQERCVEKMMCLVERHVADSNTLKYVSKILANEHNDVDPDAFSKIKTSLRAFPYMNRMVESIYVGRNSTDDITCSLTYAECTVSDRELLGEAHKYDKNAHAPGSVITGKRSLECGLSVGGCAVASVACGLCSFFTFGSCASGCIGVPLTGCGMMIDNCSG